MDEMNKAVFLDRDGTINVEKKYLYKIEDFEFLPGVFKALHLLQDAGYILIIITNQSGIARGYYSEIDFFRLNDWMLGQFSNNGIHIEKVFYCPHHPDALIQKYKIDCDCRKPKIGMFEQAINEYHLNINNCVVVGDKLRDCAICKKTKCRGFLISNHEAESILEMVKKGEVSNVEYAEDLLNAAKKILED